MPPRIPSAWSLRASNAPLSQFTLPLRPFSATTTPLAKSSGRKQKTHDPYILAQQARKKAANLSRRADLEAAREASMGDPVRGIPTPFVESFATATPLPSDPEKAMPKEKTYLNYALKPQLIDRQLKQSEKLAVPLDQLKKDNKYPSYEWSDLHNPASNLNEVEKVDEAVEAKRQKDHERATEAIKRITALENGSSKDRMKINIARCVDSFGRHNTDHILPPRAPPLPTVGSTPQHPLRPATNAAAATKRLGPDTGSSEVQIAIITAKINNLADFLAKHGKGDKHNKRNLRLLVHRRQKLLQYLRRKERGGPRWQHCIETLGLTEATWRGEITV
ncbi:ribosomal protein-like protein S15 [Periconia macrospinosa]|uniref:Ribosomal protein-like protein S15 n=1 Tax=Periconia macrospinosa TaxID=97972 RepID=A0A2V1E2Y3_9PLEO|nr:ribosomal protein-like protein S15 [Periconia macrospinosa]